MWDEIFKLAVQNGIWAVMFLSLLVFELKDSNSREKKYQQTIKDLSTNLGMVKDIKSNVIEVKENVEEIKDDVAEIKGNVTDVKHSMFKREKIKWNLI